MNDDDIEIDDIEFEKYLLISNEIYGEILEKIFKINTDYDNKLMILINIYRLFQHNLKSNLGEDKLDELMKYHNKLFDLKEKE